VCEARARRKKKLENKHQDLSQEAVGGVVLMSMRSRSHRSNRNRHPQKHAAPPWRGTNGGLIGQKCDVLFAESMELAADPANHSIQVHRCFLKLFLSIRIPILTGSRTVGHSIVRTSIVADYSILLGVNSAPTNASKE